MQTLHWVDLKDPVVQTWPDRGVLLLRCLQPESTDYHVSKVLPIRKILPAFLGEVHVALIDDGTHYRDTEYYQQPTEEGLDVPTSYWLGTPACQEKKAKTEKVKAVQPRNKVRGQTKSGRRKGKAGLDR